MSVAKWIKEPERDIPVTMETDVVVAGGGPAGFAAALAAARQGAKVLLVERYGFIGGMCSAGYVTLLPIWNLTPWQGEKMALVSGIAEEILLRLDEEGAAVKAATALERQSKNPVLPCWPTWTMFDFEAIKFVMQDMLQKAGVKLLLHTFVAGTLKEGNQVQGLIVANKLGRQALLGKVTIDCTGDGDVAYYAGASWEKAPADKVMPLTLPFYMGGVDSPKVDAYLKEDPGLSKLLQEKGARLIGDNQVLKVPAKLMLSRVELPDDYQKKEYVQTTRNGEWYVWGAHSFGKDVTDAWELTEAEIETREKVWMIAKFLKQYVPGFAESYLVTSAPQIGIRESRRIVGDYMLTKDDVLKGGSFADVVVRSRTGEWELTKKESPAPFEIPYRCLTPKAINNLLVAGRCISLQHEAATLFSPRDITTCMGIGQAAGAAAALCCNNGLKPQELNVGVLQKALKCQGMNLGK
jgi:hypothetical protein